MCWLAILINIQPSLLERTLRQTAENTEQLLFPQARTPLSHPLPEERKNNIFLLQKGGAVKVYAKLNTLLPQQALNTTVTQLSFLDFEFSRKHCARKILRATHY